MFDSNANADDGTSSIDGTLFCTVERPCLFNLATDPFESENLVAAGRQTQVVLDARGRPTSRYETILRSMMLRLIHLSQPAAPPPPVSANGDGDAFPAQACAQVDKTGSWMPWEWSE